MDFRSGALLLCIIRVLACLALKQLAVLKTFLSLQLLPMLPKVSIDNPTCARAVVLFCHIPLVTIYLFCMQACPQWHFGKNFISE